MGTFMTYGSDVFAMTFGDPEGRSDPMNMVFPKVTKCTFHKYGPSGTVTRHDGLCILALNIINEKIYVFLWFWFVGVAIFSALAIVYRMVVVLVPAFKEPQPYHNGGAAQGTGAGDGAQLLQADRTPHLQAGLPWRYDG